MGRRYRAENVLLSIAGNVSPDAVRDAAEAVLGAIPSSTEDTMPERPQGTANVREVGKDVEQVHFCIGTDGTSLYDDELYTMVVLDAAMGGSMSSRLFQEIREKRGLAYSVGSYTLNYGSGGSYTVYGGTSPQHWPLVQELVRAEFDKLMKDGLADDELERTKRHIAGNTVLALEGMSGRMMRMSRNELHHGREIPIEETLGKINAVDNAAIMDLANRILTQDLVNTTAIGPFES
jgi:predicted Zn-dependent peptidase